MANPFQSRTFTRQRKERRLTHDGGWKAERTHRRKTCSADPESFLILGIAMLMRFFYLFIFFFYRPRHQTGSSQRWHSAISHPSTHHTLQYAAQSHGSRKPPTQPSSPALWELPQVVSSWAYYGNSHKTFFYFFSNIQIAVLNGVLDCESMIRQL